MNIKLPQLPNLEDLLPGGAPSALLGSGGLQLSPDEQETILQRIAKSRTASNLAYIVSALDKPGRAVRGLLGGRPRELLNLVVPFSDSLGITREEDAVSGRDLLEKAGVLAPNTEGLDAGDLAGFGLDVATDPLTYLTFGASALAKGGQVAKRAGLLADLAKVAGPSVGPRAARMTHTLESLIAPRAGEAAGASAARAMKIGQAAEKMGVDLSSLAKQPLGGAIGIGLPFRDPMTVLGTGVVGQKYAKQLDAVSRALQFARIPGTQIRPVSALNRLFNAQVGNAESQVGQRYLMPMLHAGREEALSRARGATGEAARLLADSSNELAEPTAEAAKQLRGMFENIGEIPPELTDLHAHVRSVLDEMPSRAQEWGTKLHEMLDPEAGYFPRYATEQQGQSGQIVSVADPSNQGRELILKRIKGGTPTLMEIAQDVAAARGAPGLAHRLNDQLVDQLANVGANKRNVLDFIEQKYAQNVPELYVKPGASTPLKTDITIRNQRKDLAKYLSTAELSKIESGIYGNHPLIDFARRTSNFEQAQDAAENIVRAFADPKVMGEAARTATTRNTVPLGNVLKALKFDPRRAVEKIGQLRGITDPAQLKALAKAGIPADLAGDLTRYVESFKGPKAVGELMQVYDSIANAFKVGVTSPWPAFHARNLLSGQLENWFRDMFSPRSVLEARKVAHGQDASLGDLPQVRAALQARGLANTPTNATEALRQLAYKHGVATSGVGEFASMAGNAVEQAGGLTALHRQFPGGLGGSSPNSTAEALARLVGKGDATWNPANATLRGVGRAAESTFAPAAAGEALGQYVETLNRLAPFIHLLRKGVDPGEAARMINAAQIDYSSRALTSFERQAMKRLFPFYTFTRNVLPRTITDLARRPGGKMGQTIRALTKSQTNDEIAPDYLKTTANIRIPEGAPLIGPKQGNQRYLSSLGLMFEDALPFLGAKNAQDLLLGLGSHLGPVPKSAVETMTGKSLFQRGPNGPVDLAEQDPPLGRLLANLNGSDEPVKLPQTVEQLAANLPTSRLLSTLRTLTDSRKNAGIKALNTLTGFKLTDVPERRREAILRDLLDQFMQQTGARRFERTYYNRDDLSQMSPDEQTAALEATALQTELARRARQRAQAARP